GDKGVQEGLEQGIITDRRQVARTGRRVETLLADGKLDEALDLARGIASTNVPAGFVALTTVEHFALRFRRWQEAQAAGQEADALLETHRRVAPSALSLGLPPGW